MQRFNGQLINQFPNTVNGNAAAGAQVTIRVKSSGALAALYATDSLTGGTLPNPITADVKGYYGFYAPDGVYTLDVNIAGTPQLEIQLQDVASLKAQFDNAVLNAGYIIVGTFADGCTVYQANGVVSDNGALWRWDGELPKVVTAGSQPVPAGAGGWEPVGSSFADYIGEVAPSNPQQGSRWYNPSIPTTFIYYVDANSSQWVEEVRQGGDSPFVTPEMFGVKGDGSDESAPLSAAINYAKSNKAKLVSGNVKNIKINSQLDFSGDYFDIDLSGIEIDATGIPAGTTGNQRYAFKFSGSLGSPVTVSNSIAEGSVSIDGVGSISLSNGDIVLIKSNQTFVDGYSVSSAKRGEMLLVKSASAGFVEFDGATYFSYDAAQNITISKVNYINSPKINLGKITCAGDGSVISGVRVDYAYKPEVFGCEIVGAEDSGIQLWNCYGGSAYKNTLSNITSPSEGGGGVAWESGYGIVCYEACRGVDIYGNTFTNNRRAVTGGGTLPSIHVNQYNNYASGGFNGFGTHEPCLDWKVENNNIEGMRGRGITVRGQKTKVVNNTITNCAAEGIRIRSFYAGTYGIKGVELVGNNIKNCGGNGIWIEGTSTEGRVSGVVISGGSVTNCAFNLIYGSMCDDVSISGVSFGYVKFGTSAVIDGNLILFRGSATVGDDCTSIKIYGNTAAGKPLRNGLSFRYAKGVTVDNFVMDDYAVVHGYNFQFCTDVSVSGGSAKSPDVATGFRYPIYFEDCSKISVTGSFCYGFAATANVHGLRVQAASASVDHAINGCQFFDCDKAVSIVSAGSNHSVVTGNNGRNCTNATKFDVVSANKVVANNLS